MQVHDAQLRLALREQLGDVLTPEVVAHIEAMAEVAGPGLTNEQRPEFFAFINEALGAQYEPSKSRVFARVDSEIRAVVLFTEPRKWSVEMAVASDGSKAWMSRRLLRAAFGYPFKQLGKARITARIESDNARAIALDEALGFTHEGVQRRQFGTTDCVLMGMVADQCRWLKEKTRD